MLLEPPDFETAGGPPSAPSLPISSPAGPVAPGSSDLRGQWTLREQGRGPGLWLNRSM